MDFGYFTLSDNHYLNNGFRLSIGSPF